MKVQIRDKEALDSLTVASLRAYLEAHGWGNERPWGTWATILSKAGNDKMWEVSVPNEAGGVLYAESVAEIIATLANAEERSQLDVFNEMTNPMADAGASGNHKGGENMTTQGLGRLERVNLREAWESEPQDFTPWLARSENLAVLSDTLGMELTTEGTEQRVGPFSADILCQDTQDGSRVVIENQLERTNHIHLGQLLTYAAGLQTETIIWVAATFTDEHRAALDWLNEVTDDRFRFFGLEIELWRIGDSPAAPKFNVVSRPNNWSRTTQRVASGEIPESSLKQQRFWEQLSQHLEKRAGNVNLAAPRARAWTRYSLGRTGFHLEAVLNPQAGQIRVELRLTGPDSKAHFGLLESMKDAIEREIDSPLDWAEQPSTKVSRVILPRDADPDDENDWPNQVRWIAETFEKFDRAFRHRVRDINAADWQGDDDMIND